MQMHHTAVQLRAMMPQADFRHALGLVMTDMEAAAKAGKSSVIVTNGDHGIDDMEQWVEPDRGENGRAARIAKELDRLGYSVRYRKVMPHTNLTYQMIVSW